MKQRVPFILAVICIQRTQLESDSRRVYHDRRLATTEHPGAMDRSGTVWRQPNTHPNPDSNAYRDTDSHTKSNSHSDTHSHTIRRLRSRVESEPGLLQHGHHQLQRREHGQQERLEL
jgi:hypothetical protein